MLLSYSLIFILFGMGQENNINTPHALIQAQRTRASTNLNTARVEYTVTHTHDGSTTSQFYSFKAADDAFITVIRGDEKGVVAYLDNGEPAPPLLNQRWNCLSTEGEVWLHREETPDAEVWGEKSGRHEFRMRDMRELGLNPVMPDRNLDEYLNEVGSPTLSYETRQEQGLHIVRRNLPDTAIEWWIDPDRDWNIIKTMIYGDGGAKKISEERFTLRLDPYDGMWFPSRMERWSFLEGAQNPMEVIEIHAAEFNRPEHPVKLTPADIGVEVGMLVVYRERKENAAGYWDGEKILPGEEFQKRIESGELSVGPNTARARALERIWAQFDSGVPKYSLTSGEHDGPRYIFQWQSYETEWEAYTRRFIIRYKLDEEQTQKAWAICNECQERGRAYIARRKPVLEEIDKRLRKPASATGGEELAQRGRLESEKADNLAPLTKIFEEQLKPRLERLPTRAQRRAAEFEPTPEQK